MYLSRKLQVYIKTLMTNQSRKKKHQMKIINFSDEGFTPDKLILEKSVFVKLTKSYSTNRTNNL